MKKDSPKLYVFSSKWFLCLSLLTKSIVANLNFFLLAPVAVQQTGITKEVVVEGKSSHDVGRLYHGIFIFNLKSAAKKNNQAMKLSTDKQLEHFFSTEWKVLHGIGLSEF